MPYSRRIYLLRSRMHLGIKEYCRKHTMPIPNFFMKGPSLDNIRLCYHFVFSYYTIECLVGWRKLVNDQIIFITSANKEIGNIY